MAIRNRTQKLLSLLLPVGVLGVSAALASAHTAPSTSPSVDADAASHDTLKEGIAARLEAIRSGVSGLEEYGLGPDETDPRVLLAQWVNFGGGGVGWRNGGWGNGGWRNGGWRNGGWGNGGWHNGWGNGGWHNWGNGGWHNFWRNG